MRHKLDDIPKCDRALKLHKQSISHEAIAARLGIKQRHVNSYIKAGFERRKKIGLIEIAARCEAEQEAT